jgi:hypothetical protein
MDFSSYVHQYYKSGYLVYQESGEAGKVCADHMNKTIPSDEVGRVLNKLGESMCSLLEYRDLKSIEIEIDDDETNKVRIPRISIYEEKFSVIPPPFIGENLKKIRDNFASDDYV